MGYFLNKVKFRFISLRTSILSIFISLFVTIAFLFIFIDNRFFISTMSHVAFKLMNQASQNVYHSIVDEMRSAEEQVRLSAMLMHSGVLNPAQISELVAYTYHAEQIGQSSLVQAMVWGSENGDAVITEKYSGKSILTEVIYKLHHQIRQSILYHGTGNKISQTINIPSDFDPRTRPWYKEAKSERKLVWTGPFVFELASKGLLGVTAAMPVYNLQNKFIGAFAAGIRLDFLKKFITNLSLTPNSIIFLVTENGKLVSFSGIDLSRYTTLQPISFLSLPWVIQSFDLYHKSGKSNFSFQYHGNRYLANYQHLPHFGSLDWLIAFVVPEKDFIAELIRGHIVAVIFCFIVLFIGIFLVSALVARVIRPLNILVNEIEQIKSFHLQKTKQINTYIKEIFQISRAIYAMKNGLRSFQKYVPTLLVRQLIEVC